LWAAASVCVALFLAVPGGPAAATGSTGSHAKTVKVSTTKINGIGTVLTTSAGLTLYWFKDDKPGTSTCSGACAKIWPPLLASKGAHVSGPHGVKGLTLMNVGSGHWQVVFHELPLYRFEGDTKKGQAHGQNVGGVWFAALKSGLPASATAGTTGTAGTATTTSTTAGGATTTQPATSTTQRSSSNSSAGANVTTPTQAPTPATMPTPAVTPPTQATQATPTTSPPPPTTTPPTPPPTTTPTTSAGGGGYGY
jgi:predicted lipoprotein with Yx(FWY)xxD motif